MLGIKKVKKLVITSIKRSLLLLKYFVDSGPYL